MDNLKLTQIMEREIEMDNLNETLTEIMLKIKNFHSLYEQNEMAVRIGIVEPILRNLGWDTTNPAEVQPNMSTNEGGIPDYSLIKDGKPVLFVEVKKMSVDVEKKEVISQLGKYSYSEGTEYGILTNGIVWMLIRSFEKGTKPDERKVWKTDIEKDGLSKAIRKITTISKANIEQIDVLVKKIQILDEIWQSLLDNPEEIVTGLSIVVEPIISQSYSNYQFEDPEIKDFLREKIKEIISGQSDKENGVQTEQSNGKIDSSIITRKRKNLSKSLPPDGTMCRFSYSGSNYYNGSIKNRQLSVDNKGAFSSFSGASKTLTNGISLNGWLYWEIKLPGKDWQLADTWRKSNRNDRG